MPTITITKTYADGDVLFESDLDNIIDDIETFLNVTKIDNTNIQDNGIDASTKVSDASVTSAKIASGAITTTKILDAAVTTDKLNDLAVTTAKLNDLAVTTAKLADASVTYAKRASATISTSSSSGTYSTTSTSRVDVTNLTVSITTTGRPVLLVLQGSTSAARIVGPAGTTGSIYLMRGGTDIAGITVQNAQYLPAVSFFDSPAAGTYTYKIQAVVSASTMSIDNQVLVAVEL